MDNIVNKSGTQQCQESVKSLERELRDHGLLPQKFDWLGESRTSTYAELCIDHPTISHDHLEKLLGRLLELSHALNPTPTPSNSLIATQHKQPESQLPEYKPDPKKGNLLSLLGEDTEVSPAQFESNHTQLSPPVIDADASNNNNTTTSTTTLPPSLERVKLNYASERTCTVVTKNVTSRVSCTNSNFVARLVSKELRGTNHLRKLPPTCVYNRLKKLTSIVGHKDAIYCLKFDITGTRVFSGADDYLVKVFAVETGRLLATLRGHEGEITDMAVNMENTMLATSSVDNTIRVWNLNTYALESVLIGHSKQEPNVITTVSFSPDSKVLISGDNNGECKIWAVDEFHKQNQQALTVSCAPSTIKCLSISKGGSFFATVGDTVVRIWSISSSPQLIAQLRSHRESVYYVQYSHFTDQIVTGSDDGTCRIWTPQGNKTWRHVVLSPKSGNAPTPARKIGSIRMAIWSGDDRSIIAAAANTILVWDSVTGTLRHLMTEHKKEVYVLDGHPYDPRIAVSAGYDGEVIVWDITKGVAVYKAEIDTAYIGCELTDGGFARSGSHFAVCGMAGRVHIFGTGTDWGYRNTPAEQFFATDFHPVLRDQHGWVIDERTQMLPHLIKAPPVVNFAGDAYVPQPPATPGPFPIDPNEVAYTRERQREMLRLEIANAEKRARGLIPAEEPEAAVLLPAKPPPRRRSRPWREALPSPPQLPDSSDSDSSDSEFSGSEQADEEDAEGDYGEGDHIHNVIIYCQTKRE